MILLAVKSKQSSYLILFFFSPGVSCVQYRLYLSAKLAAALICQSVGLNNLIDDVGSKLTELLAQL